MATDKPASKVEGVYARVRANPLVATLVIVATVVGAVASFSDATTKLIAPFKRQTPAAARTQLAQLNLAYTNDAFVQSAAAGDATAVALFLRAGMDPDARSAAQGGALNNAAFHGRNEVVSLLLVAGARGAAADDHPSALGSAAAGGHDDILRTLLDRKPAPDAAALDEAFAMAARRDTFPQARHYDAMRLLASRGADVKKTAPRIFENIFDRGLGEEDATEVTKVLLDLGADANGAAGNDAKGVGTKTPLMGAAVEGYASTVDLLLARGARIDVRHDRPEPDDRGWTALALAVRSRRAMVVEKLIAAGADVEQAIGNGDNALLLASRHGDTATMRAVLAKATRIDVPDRDGRTALMLLAEGTRWPGMDAEVPLEAMTLLLQRGARVDAKDRDGTTALMVAAASGSAASVRLLLAHGARAGARDAKGRRAIEHARTNEDPARVAEVTRLLARA